MYLCYIIDPRAWNLHMYIGRVVDIVYDDQILSAAHANPGNAWHYVLVHELLVVGCVVRSRSAARNEGSQSRGDHGAARGQVKT